MSDISVITTDCFKPMSEIELIGLAMDDTFCFQSSLLEYLFYEKLDIFKKLPNKERLLDLYYLYIGENKEKLEWSQE